MDPETLARHLRREPVALRLRTGPAGQSATPDCIASKRFSELWQEAVRNFRLASDLDALYLSSRVNLVSALLLVGRGTEALAAANEALEVHADDTDMLGLRALSMYFFGKENGVETADTSIRLLQDLHRRFPGSNVIAYNLASLSAERGRHAAAVETWRAFLALETTGRFAEVARDWVSDPPPEPTSSGAKRATAPSPPEPPIPLGSLDAATRLPPGTRVTPFKIGDFECRILSHGATKALAINDIVEIVDTPSEESSFDAQRFYGPPDRIVATTDGELRFYPGFFIDLGRSTRPRRVYFEDRSAGK
jgi:hypothetical protein